MVPYIVILVFILVMTLFLVYTQSEGFTIGGLIVTEQTTVKDGLEFAKNFLKEYKDILARLDENPEFDEELTLGKAIELGMSYNTLPDGKIATQKPLAKAMKAQFQNDVNLLANMIEKAQKSIDSGELRPGMSIKAAAQALTPPGATNAFNKDLVNQMLSKQVNLLNIRKEYVDLKMPKKKPVEQAAKEKLDLESVFGGAKKALKSSNLSEMEVERAPELSEQQTQELEDRISKRVAKNLKDTLLTKRTSEPVYGGMPCPFAPYESNAIQQGQEFTQEKPSSPDMSEYIRKDSIPCWNCSLPN